METRRATVAAHLLRSARALGADFVFTNLGSDHPAFIQAFAALDDDGSGPEPIVCPHEMTALSAAHGYAMITRRPQLVLVHVDVGTQNLGGSVHNAARARVPAIVVAGLSPLTLAGDRVGTRTEIIHFTQDVPNQADIVRPYMKWSYELRAPETVHEVLARAAQMASAAPEGPVYLTGARELWEETVAVPLPRAVPAAELGGLAPGAEERVLRALARAERPLVLTSYLGRAPRAVELLVRLSERLGLPVQQPAPQYLNFPARHPHHVGYARERNVDRADCLLVLDADVPWLPQFVRPAPGTPVFLIDVDPLKEGLGFWSFPLDGSFRADTEVALEQLLRRAEAAPPDAALLEKRRAWIAELRRAAEPAPVPASEAITPAALSQALAQLIDDDMIVLAEALTSMPALLPRLPLDRPGSFYASGGSGLGWAINAAIGAKLAQPQRTVVALVGDGAYQFGVPGSAYWVARHYDAPTLTVIFNNGGWRAPKHSNDLVHPGGGPAGAADKYWITMTRGARLAEMAAAAGEAAAFRVSAPAELGGVLREALAVVRAGRAAVVDVVLAPASRQRLGRRPARGRAAPDESAGRRGRQVQEQVVNEAVSIAATGGRHHA